MRVDQRAAWHVVSFFEARWGRLARGAAFALAATFASAPGAEAQQQAIVQPGYAVVTGYAGFIPGQMPDGADPTDYLTINPEGPAARVIDLTVLGPQGTLSDVPKPFTVTASQVGQVFGVTLDRAAQPNIYLAATSAYGLSIYLPDENGLAKRQHKGAPGAQFVPGQFGPPELGASPNTIWRVDGVSGEVTLFANIDSGTGSVAALGALAYDPVSKQIFAVERSTGIIFRLGLDGSIRGTFDHGTEGRPGAGLAPIALTAPPPVDISSPVFDTENPKTWAFAAPARRTFALGVKDRRLYYSVAQGPQIWSAAISPSGSISGARLEVEVPSLDDRIEISSITFDGLGRMYLAERGATTGDYFLYQLANEGQSRVLRYVPKPPGDPNPGRWRLIPDQYSIGLPPAFNNADGGVALNHGYRQDGKINLGACGATLWSTGERLLDPGDGSTDFPNVDGLQGNGINLIQPQNTPPVQSWFVDYDDQPGDPAFRGYMGAIATIQCAGAPPPPPPPVCPSWTQLRNGQCIPLPCPQGQARTNQGKCVPIGCPEGQVRGSQGQCVPVGCPNGELRNNQGQCICPQGTQRNQDSGRCVPVCPQGQSPNIQGQCVPTGCPQGQEIYKGQCVPKCTIGIRKPDGTCGPLIACNLNTHEFFNGNCVQKCTGGQIRKPDGSCGFLVACNLTTHEFYNGVCVPKCVAPNVRKSNGTCGPKFQINPGVIQPLNPGIIVQPICGAGEELYKGACVAKCVAPNVRLANGSCGLKLQFDLPLLQRVPIKP